MRNLTFVFALICCIFCVEQAFAQDAGVRKGKVVPSRAATQVKAQTNTDAYFPFANSSSNQKAEVVTQNMDNALSLSRTQEHQVYQINLDAYKTIDAQKAASAKSGDSQTLIQTIHTTHDQRDAALRQVLTPEQVKVYEAPSLSRDNLD